MPPASFIAFATTTITLDGPGATQRIVTLTPTIVQPGDTLLWVVAINAGSVQFPLPTGWDLIVANSSFGSLQILRRIVTDSEPASHQVITTAVSPQVASVLLAYRGLFNGVPAVANGMANASGTTAFACPTLNLTTYSDMYLGVCFSYFGPPAPTYTPPALSNERADIQQVVAGVTTSLAVFDLAPEATGASGVKTATASTAPVTAYAAAALLACAPALLAPMIIPTTPGALGFVDVGV